MTKQQDLQTVVDAIPGVWNQIAPDVGTVEGEEFDNDCAVECCIDANRLQTFGYPEAEAALDRLLHEHEYPYPDLLNELSNKVRLV